MLAYITSRRGPRARRLIPSFPPRRRTLLPSTARSTRCGASSRRRGACARSRRRRWPRDGGGGGARADSADWTNAEAAASIPRALLERWRGEVFKLLLERRADGSGSSPRGGREEGGGREGVELRSGSKTDSDEKTSALEAEKAALAAKLDALEARLERAAESESRAKAEAAEAGNGGGDGRRWRRRIDRASARWRRARCAPRDVRGEGAGARRRRAVGEHAPPRRVRGAARAQPPLHRQAAESEPLENGRAEAGAEPSVRNPPFGRDFVVADALASSDARTLAAELRRVESERVSLQTLGASSASLPPKSAPRGARASAPRRASDAPRRSSRLDAQKAETRDARSRWWTSRHRTRRWPSRDAAWSETPRRRPKTRAERRLVKAS